MATFNCSAWKNCTSSSACGCQAQKKPKLAAVQGGDLAGQPTTKKMDDPSSLADGIRHEGLLQPIGVTDRLRRFWHDAGRWPGLRGISGDRNR
jgi:hypothetical protein